MAFLLYFRLLLQSKMEEEGSTNESKSQEIIYLVFALKANNFRNHKVYPKRL